MAKQIFQSIAVALFLGLWPAGDLLGQSNWTIAGRSLPELRRDTVIPAPQLPDWGASPFSAAGLHAAGAPHPPTAGPLSRSAPALPRVFSAEELAFFCRIELKLEKAAGLPVKFRLGEVEVIERMEGKREW